MSNITRRPIRCLAGQWELLQDNEWLKVNSFEMAHLLAWSEPVCYAVINKVLHGDKVATFLDLAAQGWLEYFDGQPSRLSRLCGALSDLLREKCAEEHVA